MNIIFTGLLLLTALLFNSIPEKIRLFKSRPWLPVMLIFFAWVVFSLFTSSNQKMGLRYFDSRLPLLYFPLSIGLIQLNREWRDKILLGMAVIITLVSLSCLGYGIYRSAAFHNTAFLYNDALTEPVTGHQSIYISLLVNIAIYIYAYFLFYKPGWRKFNALFVIAILLLFIASFLLASRNLMLVLYASVIGFALYAAWKKKKYLEGATLIMGLVIGVFMVFKFFPKTINRFKELAYTQFSFQQTGPESHYDMAITGDQWNGANTRLAIWQCGWQLFQQNPILGVGLGDKKDKLMEVYREKDFTLAVRTEKNLHNNYFDILVGMGIIGFILFFVGWIILPLRAVWLQKDYLSMLIILSFVLAMATENYFDRSFGGMLFGFFIPFLLSNRMTKN